MARHLYGAQAYRTNEEGELERGASEPCRDADEARRKAARMVDQGGNVGATAFLIPNYVREAGGDDLITIASFGSVPLDAHDVLPF